MSHDDDRPVGRLLSRRETLALLAISGTGLLLGCRYRSGGGELASARNRRTDAQAATPSRSAGNPPCVARPEQTEGPYYVDERLNRSDIRSDPGTGTVSKGVPLKLAFQVSQIHDGRCTPLAGARVDVWHCDALGVYSDVSDFNGDNTGKRFLRGYQVTDRDGVARFTTIYPGWYQGRTVHVHFKVQDPAEGERRHEFTSQLYFDDALTDRVHERAPYASKGRRTLRNQRDGIFRDGGERLMLAPVEDGVGYAATFDLGLEIG